MAVHQGPEHLPASPLTTGEQQAVMYLQFGVAVRQKHSLRSAFQRQTDTGEEFILFTAAVPVDVIQCNLAGLRPNKAQVFGDFTFQLENPYIGCPVFQHVFEPGSSTISKAVIGPDQMLQE